MKTFKIVRQAYFAFQLLSLVLCMDEADEIYRWVNEEMSEQDQEILMDLFSIDKRINDAATGNNPIQSTVKVDHQNRNDSSLSAVIDKIGMKLSLINRSLSW